MPNWTDNRLTVIGQPQSCEEFRIINGQHLSGNSDTTLDREKASRLSRMNLREKGDIRFSALMPRRYSHEPEWSTSWGCKWDTEGDVRYEHTPAPEFENADAFQTLSAQMQWSFSTPWTSPSGWLRKMGSEFPELCIIHTSDDSENGLSYTQLVMRDGELFEHELPEPELPIPPENDGESAADKNDEEDPDQVRLELAAKNARKAHDQSIAENNDEAHCLGPFIVAIHEGDELAVSEWLVSHPDAVNERLGGYWTALHHSAFAGTAGVARVLLQSGADPLAKTSKGLGLMDFILDFSSSDASGVLEGKLAILSAAVDVAPELIGKPLYTSRTPVELAARFGAVDFLSALISGATPRLKEILENPSEFARSEQSNRVLYRPENQKPTTLPAWFVILCDEANSESRIKVLDELSGKGLSWENDAKLEILRSAMKISRPAIREDERVLAKLVSKLDLNDHCVDWAAEFKRLLDESEQGEEKMAKTRPQGLAGNGPAKRHVLRIAANRLHALDAINRPHGVNSQAAP